MPAECEPDKTERGVRRISYPSARSNGIGKQHIGSDRRDKTEQLNTKRYQITKK